MVEVSEPTPLVPEPPEPPDPGDPEDPGGSPLIFVYIDDEDVTSCVQTGSLTRRLNRPAQAVLRMFTDCAPGDGNSRVKIEIFGELWFHGFVTMISTEAGEDGNLMSEYTAEDPMFLWNFRPARAGPDNETSSPGDFSKPRLFSDPSVNGRGPDILDQILVQSEVDDNPALGEGHLFLEQPHGVATGVDGLLLADPVDFPMTIMEVFELLTSTGTVDAVITPVDTGSETMGELNIYNGDYGNDLRDTIFFDYATGNHNVRTLRMTENSGNICNKLWYYLGPRVLSHTDPEGDQHWRANITGQDGGLLDGLPGPPNGLAYLDHTPPGPGGQSVDPDNLPIGPPWTTNPLGERIWTSRETSGVRMDIQIFDAEGDERPAAYRELFRRLWQMESWIRAIPRTLVHITPVRTSEQNLLPPDVSPIQVGDFDIGDLVTVTAGAVVRGGFTGGQRIYAYTINWDEDGVLELGELLTSSDQEGTGGE